MPFLCCGQELQTISRRQERARVQASLMALWVSTTTLLTCVMMTASNIHLIVFYHRMPWGGTRHNTQLILELVRDTCIALTLSVNVFFYSYFCKNFRDVVARRWRRLCARASCGGPSVIQRTDSWPRSHGCCDGAWSSSNTTEQSTHLWKIWVNLLLVKARVRWCCWLSKNALISFCITRSFNNQVKRENGERASERERVREGHTTCIINKDKTNWSTLKQFYWHVTWQQLWMRQVQLLSSWVWGSCPRGTHFWNRKIPCKY